VLAGRLWVSLSSVTSTCSSLGAWRSGFAGGRLGFNVGGAGWSGKARIWWKWLERREAWQPRGVENQPIRKCRDGRGQVMQAKQISDAIVVLRGQRVLRDAELAALYGVTTKALNQAVKRNTGRFPEDFVFRLTQEEAQILNRSHFATGSQRHRDPRFLPLGSADRNVNSCNLCGQALLRRARRGSRKAPTCTRCPVAHSGSQSDLAHEMRHSTDHQRRRRNPHCA